MMVESVQRPLLHLSRLQKWRLLSSLFSMYSRMILMRKNIPSANWMDASAIDNWSNCFGPAQRAAGKSRGESITGLNLEVAGVYFYRNSHVHE